MEKKNPEIMLNENESVELTDRQVEHFKDDMQAAGFFTSLGAALSGKDVNNEFLKSGRYVSKS